MMIFLLIESSMENNPVQHKTNLVLFTAFLSAFLLNSGGWEEVGSIQLWNEWCRTSNTNRVLATDSFCFFYRFISDPTVSSMEYVCILSFLLHPRCPLS